MISEALHSIIISIKNNPNDSLLTQLDLLTHEELSFLYQWMLANQLKENSVNYFNELFKKEEKQALLVAFLTNTLIENPEHLITFINYLNESNLLELIKQLLEKIKIDSSFMSSLHQVLVVFCTKLNDNPKADAPLHQWNNKPYAQELVHALIQHPECIFNLAKKHRTVHLFVFTSENNLKNYLDDFLNHSKINATELNQCALICVEHFKNQPQSLHTFFDNLSLSEKNRTDVGRDNLLNLKKSIWSLLHINTPNKEHSFKEHSFQHLFTNKKILTISHPNKNWQNEFNAYQQSIWLAKTNDELNEDYSEDRLSEILAHSIELTTSSNWQKASAWLKKQERTAQLNFLKNLIRKNASFLFNQQAYQLIKQANLSNKQLEMFNEEELSWLVRYGNTKEQETWLALAQQGHQEKRFNLGLFFCALPDDPFLLEEITSKDLFSNPTVLALLFAELHNKPENKTHLHSLLPLIKNTDQLWVRSFLNEIIHLIKTANNNLVLLSLINKLILDPETALNATEEKDQDILNHYLSLLNSLIDAAKKETDKTELKQLMLNVISTLNQRNEQWAKIIFDHPAFSALCILLANNTNTFELSNPLTNFFLNPAISQLNAKAHTNPDIQKYIYNLLLLSPPNLALQQFLVLSNYLSSENKLALIRATLSQPTRLNLYDIQLTNLANCIFSEEDQQLLEQIMEEKNYKLPLYFEQLPAIKFTKNSYLYKKIKEAALNGSLNHESTLNQFYFLEYSYQQDEKNNHARLQELVKQAAHIPTEIFAQIINSYIPSFAKQENDALFFLQTIETCLKEPSLKLLNQLDKTTINLIINTALLQPDAYLYLLELLLYSNSSELCQDLIQTKINNLIKSSTEIENACFNQLTVNQLKQLETSPLALVLSLHRLIYFAKPNKEYLSFLNAETDPQKLYSKKLFCSLASLYQHLNNLDALQPDLNPILSWLINYGETHLEQYLTTMESFEQDRDIKEPLVFFHWLRWKNTLYMNVYNKNILPQAFFDWLNNYNTEQVETGAHLKAVLDTAKETNQIRSLLSYTLQHKESLSEAQILWFSEQILSYSENEPGLLATIVDLNSCSSLFALFKKAEGSQFALLKIALEKENYWQTLLENNEEKTTFIKQLALQSFSADQLIELIQCTKNKLIKEQLILFFLSQSHYLTNLQEQSSLEQLNNIEQHSPSRLNGLVQQINTSSLTKEQIQGLSSEAALSILCCVTHFSNLTVTQVQQLLAQIPQLNILHYWLNHYAAMPNGFFLFAHFMNSAESEVVNIIKNSSDKTQKWCARTLLDHLELFNKDNPLVQANYSEEYLILALKKYLHGHTHSNYIYFINQATSSLLNQNHVFSLEATQLLISLHGDPQFKELTQTTAYLINYNLKIHAEKASIELFYEGTHPNISTMVQLIPVKPKLPETEKPLSTLSQLLAPLQLDIEQSAPLLPHDHPLIDAVAAATTYISAFDYFLIYYKGNPRALQNILQHYLTFYIQETKSRSLKELYNISTLMTRQELAPELRQLIYDNFLKYPSLYDEHISYCLFLFNPQNTVQHFGLRGTVESYKLVINLCTTALKKLDPKIHAEIIHMANTALFEAKTELAFAEDNNLFSRLFRRIIRCWYYNWTGFFIPKSPVYVCPNEQAKKPEPEVEAYSSEQINYYSIQELPVLLEALKKENNLSKLNELLIALNQWEFKKQKSEEIKIRQELHHLLHKLLQASEQDAKLLSWLQENQAPLIINRFHLLELFLANNQQEEALIFLKESNEDSPYLHYLIQELETPMPTTNTTPIAIKSAEPTSSVINTAASLAQSTWTWVSAFSFFGAPPIKESIVNIIENNQSAKASMSGV